MRQVFSVFQAEAQNFLIFWQIGIYPIYFLSFGCVTIVQKIERR